MSQLAIVKYWIFFKSYRSGRDWIEPEAVEIRANSHSTSLQRYEALVRQLQENPKFIQVDQQTFATDSILRIQPQIDYPEQPAEDAYQDVPLTEEERLRNVQQLEMLRQKYFRSKGGVASRIEQELTK